MWKKKCLKIAKKIMKKNNSDKVTITDIYIIKPL